jgi:hypothetical protein
MLWRNVLESLNFCLNILIFQCYKGLIKGYILGGLESCGRERDTKGARNFKILTMKTLFLMTPHTYNSLLFYDHRTEQ